jgi:hypothetical protein
MIHHDDIERRAELIAARARILLDEFEDIDGYCRPGCPRCAITLAREEVDACYGWTTEDARVTGDVAEARAAELLGANAVHGRVL